MYIRRAVAFCFILAVFFLSSGEFLCAAGDVKVKILAVNPSSDKSLKTKISQALPIEIDPAQDIIDKAGLEVQFDPETKTNYLTKEVELQPKETKTFEVRVRDVWNIPSDQIEEVKRNLEQQILALKGTKYEDTGKLLYDKAQENLDRIVEEQGRPMAIKQHVELYRAHVQQLQDIKNNALSLDAMRRLEEEKNTGVRPARFVIEAENPSGEPKKITVRSPLPKNVKPEDVLDSQGFAILFDQSQQNYVLEKEDQFAAKELKRYTITIKDIWHISEEELKFYKEQTEKLLDLFRGSSFSSFAENQSKAIFDSLSQIGSLQEEISGSTVLADRVRAFVLNSQRLDVVKSKMRDLQQLVPELPLKKRDEADLREKIKLFVKKLADIKDVVLVAMGFRPDQPVTWWIIFGIILFLGATSAVFYMVWLKKLQENPFKKKGTGKSEKGATPPPAAEPPQTAEKK
ncbi:MAG TPA: hypothetical protein PKI45_08465 [Candidatus Omnitrophota bacterium]|nr:hypothetical protein [Candidatus Omnitrophota bacterium]